MIGTGGDRSRVPLPATGSRRGHTANAWTLHGFALVHEEMTRRCCPLVVLVLLLLAIPFTAPAQLSARSAPLPPPAFRPASDWWTITTGPTTTRQQLPPQVWAITTRSNLAALVPFDLFQGLKRLRPNGIVVWATTLGPQRLSGFPQTRLPLELSSFRVDHGWEMQPAPNIQQRLRAVRVDGWQLDVRVYFATQHPSEKLLAQAQAELDRLLLPRRG
jgi:hypothetical protein